MKRYILLALLTVSLHAQTAPKKSVSPTYESTMNILQEKPCKIGPITVVVIPMICGVAQRAYDLGVQEGRNKQEQDDYAHLPADSILSQHPVVVSLHIVMDSVQAKYPGNEWIRPCSPDNHADACFDSTLRHIISHTYQKKENCEKDEKVSCTQLSEYWLPIGKVIFVDETPEGSHAN